jgi:hypothetical protein
MIESPIVNTCIGAAAGAGAGVVAEGGAVGLSIAVLLAEAEAEAAGGLLFGLDAAEGLVVVDRAPAAEVNTTPVMREQQATVATAMAMPRDRLRVAEVNFGLSLFDQAVRSSQPDSLIMFAKFWY